MLAQGINGPRQAVAGTECWASLGAVTYPMTVSGSRGSKQFECYLETNKFAKRI